MSKNIIFKNACKIDTSYMSAHEIEFRSLAKKIIAYAINQSSLFDDKETASVTFFQEGVASVVARIEGSISGSYVFKMTEDSEVTHAEILSYKAYRENNIAAPKIYETGKSKSYVFYIMEYIEAPTFKDLILNRKIDVQTAGFHMGNILHALEAIPARGFGLPIEEKSGVLEGGEKNIMRYLTTKYNAAHYAHAINKYVAAINWQEIAHRYIERITEALGNNSVLGNFDFGARHFFNSDTIVIFDPDTELVPEYFSAAFFCTPEINYPEWKINLRKEAMKSYLKNKNSFDKNLFTAALWLLVYRKCYRLLQQPNEKRVKRAVHMLDIISHKEKLHSHIQELIVV